MPKVIAGLPVFLENVPTIASCSSGAIHAALNTLVSNDSTKSISDTVATAEVTLQRPFGCNSTNTPVRRSMFHGVTFGRGTARAPVSRERALARGPAAGLQC